MKSLCIGIATLFVAGIVSAQQIVPVVAHTNGAYGSVWRTDLKLNNNGNGLYSGKLIFTPLNQSAGVSDVEIPFSIDPLETKILEDVYTLAFPSQQGAARLTIIIEPDYPGASICYPITDVSIFSYLDDQHKIGFNTPVYFDHYDLFPLSCTGAISGQEGERDNIFVITGWQGATIEWILNSPTYISASITYPPNTTYQHIDAIKSIFSVDAGPNTPISAWIIQGSAALAMVHINNISNDGKWNDFQRCRCQ